MPPTTKKAGAKKAKPKASRSKTAHGADGALESGVKVVKKVARKVEKALEPAGKAIAKEAKAVGKGAKKVVKKVERAAAPVTRAITGKGESRGTKKSSGTKRAGTKKSG
jgi:hypothetical protein